MYQHALVTVTESDHVAEWHVYAPDGDLARYVWDSLDAYGYTNSPYTLTDYPAVSTLPNV